MKLKKFAYDMNENEYFFYNLSKCHLDIICLFLHFNSYNHIITITMIYQNIILLNINIYIYIYITILWL